MKRNLLLVTVLALVVTLGHFQPAQAIATVDSFGLYCDRVSAIGTVTSPYYVVEVYNPATGKDLIYDVFPAGTDGAVFVNLFFPALPEGTFLQYWVWASPTNDRDDWDGLSYFYAEGECEPIIPGPGAPANFVLRSVTCTSPLYDSAAGSPIGSDQVTSGQTWFVNPTPTTGADGKSWTQIFVGGENNPWVPTACVSG